MHASSSPDPNRCKPRKQKTKKTVFLKFINRNSMRYQCEWKMFSFEINLQFRSLTDLWFNGGNDLEKTIGSSSCELANDLIFSPFSRHRFEGLDRSSILKFN